MIPIFRDAAAEAFGERWASTPPGWFEPGGAKPSFVAGGSDDGDGGNDSLSLRSRSRGRPRLATTPPTTAGAAGEPAPSAASAAGSLRQEDGRIATHLPGTPPPASARGIVVATPPAASSRATAAAAAEAAGRTGGEKRADGAIASLAPASEPAGREGSGGVDKSGSRPGSEAGVSSGAALDGGNQGDGGAGDRTRRPCTTEKSNAKDLAQYLGVSGPDNDSGSASASGGTGARRAGGKRGVDGLPLGPMDEENESNAEGGQEEVRMR